MTATDLLLARIKAKTAVTDEIPATRIYDRGKTPVNIQSPCIDVQLIDGEKYSEVAALYRPIMQVGVNTKDRNEAERIVGIIEASLHKDTWGDSGYRVGAFSRGWRVFPDSSWWRAPLDVRLQIIEE